ncbi:MAG: hypothetical protein ACLR7D_15175 [Lachnospira eligens]
MEEVGVAVKNITYYKSHFALKVLSFSHFYLTDLYCTQLLKKMSYRLGTWVQADDIDGD